MNLFPPPAGAIEKTPVSSSTLKGVPGIICRFLPASSRKFSGEFGIEMYGGPWLQHYEYDRSWTTRILTGAVPLSIDLGNAAYRLAGSKLALLSS